MSKYKSWEEFLNKTYPNLYFSKQVQHILKNGDTRDEVVKKYIERLEKIHNKAFSSERKNDSNILKHFYYENYIIKPENISENYFSFLDKQYFNQYGIHMNNEMKKEHVDNIIKDQKKSLDNWINYLCSEDASFYPTWAKYWAFQGMLTIGAYDNQKGIYKKRTKDTVGPFIELNQEIFAKCIDYIINLVNNNKIDDVNQITSENFSKIYQALLSKQKEINFDKTSIEGIWIKYEQGDNYLPLYNSLQGYNTGWCTAGEDTCKRQIKNGDFYVYYTYDNEGNTKIPRIAIRMDGKDRIGEIRGVAKNQNVESHLEEVLEEKLKEFPDRKDYEKRISDSKKLTSIYEKYQNNIELELEKEDLKFIYEIDRKISGFGYDEDLRLTEIKAKRNIRKDYATIFNVSEDEVALTQEEWRDNLNKCKVLKGLGRYFYLNSSSSAEDLGLPQGIGCDLDLGILTSAEGLDLSKCIIRGSLNLRGLKSAKGLKLPKNIGLDLDLSDLTSIEDLDLSQCTIGRTLKLNSLTSAEGLVLPQTIGGSLNLKSLISAEGLVLPQHIKDDLYLNVLTSAEDLKLPQTIGGTLDLSCLISAEGLVLPETIGGSLNLIHLTSAKGLVLPETIGGSLNLIYLTSAEGLVLPKNIGGSLDLRNLKNAKGLDLSQTNIGSCLDLNGLKSAEGLDLSQTNISSILDLSGLNSAKGLILPDNFDLDRLICKSEIKQELIEQRNKKNSIEKTDEQIEENKRIR